MTTTTTTDTPTTTVLPYEGRVYALRVRAKGGQTEVRVLPLPPETMRDARQAKRPPETADHDHDPEQFRYDPDGEETTIAEAFPEGGYTVAEPRKGRRHGMTTHRGPLQPGEFLDQDRVWEHLEERLGFWRREVDRAYPLTGPTRRAHLPLRSRIDARLLALADDGVNMTRLAGAMGWNVIKREDGTSDCQRMKRALRRAREARQK